MRIINTNAGLITNFEVNKVLLEQKHRSKTTKRGTKDMIFVEKQVGHYLFKNSLVRRQSDETVAEFIAASAEFNLTIAEQLQLINLCPTTLVEIYLSVDQADVRLGTERAQELLDLILKVLYLPEDQIQESTAAEAPRLKLAPRKPGSHRGRGRGGKDSGRGRKGAQRGGRSQSAKR